DDAHDAEDERETCSDEEQNRGVEQRIQNLDNKDRHRRPSTARTADRWSMSTKPTHSPGHRSKRQSKNQPRPPGAGAVVVVTMSRATAGSGLRLRPGLLDPVGRGGRLV